MKTDFTIEPMTAKNLSEVAGLERLCFSRPWSLAALESELKNPLAVFLVARRGESVTGYAGMHDIAGEGYITNVAVAPGHRRGGVAEALVIALLNYGIENRLEFITLEVRESNAPARKLYEKLGFEIAGRRKNFYEGPAEDAVIMTKIHKHID